MRAALIGDVHANLPALQAVLEHARARRVQTIWNVGDFVGYGAFPDQVVRMIRRLVPVSIVGNYDLKVLAVPEHEARRRRPKTPEKWFAFRWAWDHLSKESRQYLAELPREVRLEVFARRVLLTHGSPASNEEHLFADTDEDRLKALAAMAEADLVICGHSHQAFVRQADGVWFVNTGSVGRSDDGDPRACYALLEVGPKLLRVRHFRVDYDVSRAARRIRRLHLPEPFALMVERGRNLDDVLAEEAAALAAEETANVDESAVLQAVTRLAEECSYEAAHTHQVTGLALSIFDQLADLHRLGHRQRFWLHCAGLLHDVGWMEGRRAHHKTAARIVLHSRDVGLNLRQRQIVACVARYHRKALPSPRHQPYAALDACARRIVRVLAGILRVADGLDNDHLSAVQSVTCRVLPRRIVFACRARFRAEAERRKALQKSDLMAQEFHRKIVVQWRLG